MSTTISDSTGLRETGLRQTGLPRTAPLEMNLSGFETLQRRMTNPWLMRGFMLRKMPLGLMAGLRVASLEPTRCETTVPYGWRTTNPFRSTYFAAQSMAAELSTGALAMAAIELAAGSTAMLIVGMEAEFGKKATSRVTFTCDDGAAIFAAVQTAHATDAPATVRATTVGRMADGVEVARFAFTWSFKKRSSKKRSVKKQERS